MQKPGRKPMFRETMGRIDIRLPVEVLKYFEEQAAREGTNLSAVIREVLTNHYTRARK